MNTSNNTEIKGKMKKIVIGIGIALVIALVIALAVVTPTAEEIREKRTEKLVKGLEKGFTVERNGYVHDYLLHAGFSPPQSPTFTVERNGYLLKVSHPPSPNGIFDDLDFTIDTSNIEQEKVYVWSNNGKVCFETIVTKCDCDNPKFIIHEMAITLNGEKYITNNSLRERRERDIKALAMRGVIVPTQGQWSTFCSPV